MRDIQHMDITVVVGDEQCDMRVPREVTFEHLGELIVRNLREEGVPVPSSWTMRIEDKDFSMAPTDWIGDFAVADGDVFVIVSGTQELKP